MRKRLLFAALLVLLAVSAVLAVNMSKKGETQVKEETPLSENSDDSAAVVGAEEKARSSESGSSEWADYKSAQGVSFGYPRRAWGTCNGSEALVDVRVFDDFEEGRIYLTSDCAATLESLRQLSRDLSEGIDGYRQEKFFYGWNMAVKKVDGDQELDSFVKEHYGRGCAVTGKEPAIQEGVYDIKLNSYKDAQGNDADLGSTVCPTNYTFNLLYDPQRKLAVSLVLGQEPTFCLSGDYSVCYDEIMNQGIRLD